jgi:hypothetical protein
MQIAAIAFFSMGFLSLIAAILTQRQMESTRIDYVTHERCTAAFEVFAFTCVTCVIFGIIVMVMGAWR